MKAYADTNFLLRIYLDYDDSERAISLLSRLTRRTEACPVAWLQQIEFSNALQLLVFQSRAGARPRVSNEMAAMALQSFNDDLDRGVAFREANLGAGELTATSRSLSGRHTASIGSRTYDVIHVAAALRLGCDTFWSFDVKASKLAKLEGLKVL